MVEPHSATAETSESIQLVIRGMHCASCVSTVERALRNVPGVQTATVNLAVGEAAVGAELGFRESTAAGRCCSAGRVRRRSTPCGVRNAAHCQRRDRSVANTAARRGDRTGPDGDRYVGAAGHRAGAPPDSCY